MEEQKLEITKSEVNQIVLQCASEVFFVDIKSINDNSRFDEDLFADGISLLDFLDLIENKFLNYSLSISISKSIFSEQETIGELSNALWNEVVSIVGQ